MSRNYKFHDPEGLYFVSFAVIEWLYVFTRRQYKDLLLETMSYSQQFKGMEIFAWCIMTNHVHIVFRSIGTVKPEIILGDLKRYTSKKIISAIIENPQESRKEWLLNQFQRAAQSSSNVNGYHFWRHDNRPIELSNNRMIDQKIDYVHNNPVEAGIVLQPEHYIYSSAIDYAGGKGILENVQIMY